MKNAIMTIAIARSGIVLNREFDAAEHILGYGIYSGTYGCYVNPDRQRIDTRILSEKRLRALSIESITLNPLMYFGTDREEIRIFFHELSHATGRANRLNRIGITSPESRVGTKACAIEEIIADTSASLLLYHFGYTKDRINADTSAYIHRYLKKYIPKEEWDQVMVYTLKEATKARNYIINNWLYDIQPNKESSKVYSA